MKKILFALFSILTIILLFWLIFRGGSADIIVTSFDECIEAGNPAMESYPRQCRHGDDTFVEDIGNEVEKQHLILMNFPRPGDTVNSPLRFTGKAMGQWYFEAVFPVEIEDAHGRVIGVSHGMAQDNWMVDEFVNFEGTINFDIPEGEATNAFFVLKKDNPSGLEENADELRVPIMISNDVINDQLEF